MRSTRGRQWVAALALAGAAVALGAAPAAAQPVRLRLAPRLGDTLRLRLEQRVEMVGTRRVGTVDSTLATTSRLVVASRVVAVSRDAAGTLMHAVTDSVMLAHSGPDSARLAAFARRTLEGRRSQLRVGADGTTSMVDGVPLRPQIQTVLAQMPATFPGTDVEVGARWSRRLVVPLSSDPRAPAEGVLDASFRLDSVSRGGEQAYVSMSGRLSRSAPPRDAGRLTTLEMAGEMSGHLVIDQRRGWITDARTTMIVYSLVGARRGNAGEPVRTRMTVTQRLRVW